MALEMFLRPFEEFFEARCPAQQSQATQTIAGMNDFHFDGAKILDPQFGICANRRRAFQMHQRPGVGQLHDFGLVRFALQPQFAADIDGISPFPTHFRRRAGRGKLRLRIRQFACSP